MHPDGPAMLILKKSDAGHPDFSGPDFSSARHSIIMELSPDTGPDPVVETGPELQSAGPIPHPKGMCDALLEIADQLREASKKHLGQAERIEELCAEMMGEQPPDSDYHGEGEAKELE